MFWDDVAHAWMVEGHVLLQVFHFALHQNERFFSDYRTFFLLSHKCTVAREVSNITTTSCLKGIDHRHARKGRRTCRKKTDADMTEQNGDQKPDQKSCEFVLMTNHVLPLFHHNLLINLQYTHSIYSSISSSFYFISFYNKIFLFTIVKLVLFT